MLILDLREWLIFQIWGKIISIQIQKSAGQVKFQISEAFSYIGNQSLQQKTRGGILVLTLDLFCHYATRLNYLRLVICQKNLVQFRHKISQTNHGVIATKRKGAPLPSLIFIGKAITKVPLDGSLSKLATFSKKGILFLQRIRCVSKNSDFP